MSKINYDLTRIKGMVFDVDGVLSPATIPMSAEGEPLRMANIKDGYALQLAVKKGFEIAIITGGDTIAVTNRFGALGVRDIYLKAGTKLPVLREWMEQKNMSAGEVMYMGDDIPDLECMEHVGLPVAPADAAVEIKEVSRYITMAAGGYGAAREVIEEILKANDMWLTRHDAFGW